MGRSPEEKKAKSDAETAPSNATGGDSAKAPEAPAKKASKPDDDKGVKLVNTKGREVHVPAAKADEYIAHGFKKA